MNNNDELTFECSGEVTYVEVEMYFVDMPAFGIWKDREDLDEEVL